MVNYSLSVANSLVLEKIASKKHSHAGAIPQGFIMVAFEKRSQRGDIDASWFHGMSFAIARTSRGRVRVQSRRAMTTERRRRLA